MPMDYVYYQVERPEHVQDEVQKAHSQKQSRSRLSYKETCAVTQKLPLQ